MEQRVAYPYLPEGRSISYVPRDDKFMALAKAWARAQSLDTKMPGTAVVVKNGRVIGIGANGSTYHKEHGCERVRLGCKSGQGYELCEGCSPKNHSEPTANLNSPKIIKHLNEVLFLFKTFRHPEIFFPEKPPAPLDPIAEPFVKTNRARIFPDHIQDDVFIFRFFKMKKEGSADARTSDLGINRHITDVKIALRERSLNPEDKQTRKKPEKSRPADQPADLFECGEVGGGVYRAVISEKDTDNLPAPFRDQYILIGENRIFVILAFHQHFQPFPAPEGDQLKNSRVREHNQLRAPGNFPLFSLSDQPQIHKISYYELISVYTFLK